LLAKDLVGKHPWVPVGKRLWVPAGKHLLDPAEKHLSDPAEKHLSDPAEKPEGKHRSNLENYPRLHRRKKIKSTNKLLTTKQAGFVKRGLFC
jgi:hypothetical protein